MPVRLATKSNDAPPRDLLRQSLAAAIANHAALIEALADNKASQQRAEEARFTAITAVDKATEALEEAKISDAHALAHGDPGSAVKTARLTFQDAEDVVEAARSARTLLTDQLADLTNRLSISDMRVNDAVAAVVRNAPEVHDLITRYETARREFHDIHGVLGVLFAANVLPRELNVAVQNIDINQVIHQDLPPSATAAQVRQWITALRTDAEATLE
jgi:hypothetical protein